MRPEPEPAVQEVAGSARDLVLKVYAVADSARYECSAPPTGILFKPTMMFQSRVYTFSLTNTSTARMDYKFTVCSADGSMPDGSGLYTVTPQGGVLEAGTSAEVSVRFSPQEVDDCARLLVCTIPGLDAK
jgi:hydrocephalus-inducing protein